MPDIKKPAAFQLSPSSGSLTPPSTSSVKYSDILAAIAPNINDFYNNSGIQANVSATITSQLNNWVSSPSNPFLTRLTAAENNITSILGSITTIRGDINALTTSNNNQHLVFSNNITTLNTNVAALQTKMNQVISGIDPTLINLKTLDERITLASNRITTDENALAAYKTQNDPKVEANRIDIIALKNIDTQLTNQINAVSNDLNTFITTTTNNIGLINTTAGTLRTDLTAVSNRVTTLEGTASKFTNFLGTTSLSTLDLLDGQIATLTSNYGTLSPLVTTNTNAIQDHALKISDIETFLALYKTDIENINTIKTDLTDTISDLSDLTNTVNGVIVGGKVQSSAVELPISNSLNQDGLGVDYPAALLFAAPKDTYDNIIPKICKRINETELKFTPLIQKVTNVEGGIAAINTTLNDHGNKISNLETNTADLPTIRTNIATLQSETSNLKLKTSNLSILGTLPETFVTIDQATAIGFNNRKLGSTYNGDEEILQSGTPATYKIIDVLKGFYSRIDNLKELTDAMDIGTIVTELANLEQELNDAIAEYTLFNTDTNAKIDGLNDTHITGTQVDADLNSYAVGKRYTGDKEIDATAGIQNINKIVFGLLKRINEFKLFYEEYKINQILDTKIESTADKTLMNTMYDGSILTNIDKRFVSPTATLKDITLVFKAHIDAIQTELFSFYTNNFRGISSSFAPGMDDTKPNPYNVVTKGNSIINKDLEVKEDLSVAANAIVSGFLDAGQLRVSGVPVDVVRKQYEFNRTATTNIYLTQPTAADVTGIYISPRTGIIPDTSSSVGTTLVGITLGGAPGNIIRSDVKSRSYSVVGNMADVCMTVHYSFLVNCGSIGSQAVSFDLRVKDSFTLDITKFQTDIQNTADKYANGIDHIFITDIKAGSRGLAFPNSDTRASLWTGSTPPLLTNVLVSDCLLSQYNAVNLSGSQLFTASSPSHALHTKDGDPTNTRVIIDTGYKNFTYYGSAGATRDKDFFVNVTVKLIMNKVTW